MARNGENTTGTREAAGITAADVSTLRRFLEEKEAGVRSGIVEEQGNSQTLIGTREKI